MMNKNLRNICNHHLIPRRLIPSGYPKIFAKLLPDTSNPLTSKYLLKRYMDRTFKTYLKHQTSQGTTGCLEKNMDGYLKQQ